MTAAHTLKVVYGLVENLKQVSSGEQIPSIGHGVFSEHQRL